MLKYFICFIFFIYFFLFPVVSYSEGNINDQSCFRGQSIPFDQKILDNIVFIKIQHRDGSVTYGSGSIVNNKDEHGHNKILTARHMFKDDVNGVLVFNHYGKELGYINDFPIFSLNSWNVETVKIDNINLSIIPINKNYDKIHGLSISHDALSDVKSINISYPFGFAQGGSGSPVLNDRAEIMGVASSDAYATDEDLLNVKIINFYHYINSNSNIYNNVKFRKQDTLYISPIGNNKESFYKGHYIIPGYAAQSCIIYKSI